MNKPMHTNEIDRFIIGELNKILDYEGAVPIDVYNDTIFNIRNKWLYDVNANVQDELRFQQGL